MNQKNNRIEIASDCSNGRDGIGVYLYKNNKLKIEVFRDDNKQSRIIRIFEKGNFIDIPLELMDEIITAFKKEIPWDFLD